MTKTLKKLWQFLDNNLCLILAGFFLAFIPLYPKIPLWSPIETYIVRVRLEDLLIAIAFPLTLIQIWRKKAKLHPVTTKLFAVYAVVGLLSILSAILITQTVPLQLTHIAKTLLHYFRYLEYFAVFFLTFAAIKNFKDVQKLLVIITITILLVGVYGYMQKYFYWPVYSTMNREFSKGIRLYLTEHARIQSTFAGHYDLAAYLVITMPIILALGLAQTKWRKYALYMTYFVGSWLMVMSASRMPYFAYLISSYLVVVVMSLNKKKLLDKFIYWLTRSFGLSLMTFFLLYYFGQGMLDRLSNVISTSDKPINLTQILDNALSSMPIPNSKELLTWLPKSPIQPTESQPAPTENEILIAQVSAPSDQPPVAIKPIAPKPNEKPRDVYVEVPEPVTTQVTLPDGTTAEITLHKQRVFSDCALKHELSLCIRLESLWPWAIQSFTHNPIFGTGYATLNKQFVNEFTFADSTDNNYLRTLGETGVLGFLSFYGVIVYLVFANIRLLHKLKNLTQRSLLFGFLASTIGLLINAIYIDVFAASKVAYTYWLIAGLCMAYGKINQKEEKALPKLKTKK